MTTVQLSNLIDAARLGNRDAFAELVGHYQGLVSAAALNAVGDFQQAEDLAQETFLIAWRRLAELNDVQKFPTWLCGIARNCAKNRLRKQNKDPLSGAAELQDIAAADPGNAAAQADEARLVWQRLESIPETYREPLLMFYRHGADISEIASALELSKEAVRQRLSRGRKLLKSEVERIVEKTLAGTRPDTAFTLAVLASIPLAATAGCSATSKSLGLLSGGTVMSQFGIIGGILLFFVLLLVQSASSILIAAIYFYAIWYAVKNSPTLRTRRFVIEAVLDYTVLVTIIGFVSRRLLPSRSTQNEWMSELINFWGVFPEELRYFLFQGLPVLLVFSLFLMYVILRWRRLLYEDLNGESVDKTSRAEPSLFAKLFENELWELSSTIKRWQEYFLTINGLRLKRNIVLGIVVLSMLRTFFWTFNTFFGAFGQSGFLRGEPVYYNLTSILWTVLYSVIYQFVFFYLIWHGIRISKDEAALEVNPPQNAGHWNIEELSPTGRRRILFDTLILLALIPIAANLLSIVLGFIRVMYWHYPYTDIMLPDFVVRIEIVLIVLTALWASKHPNRCFKGFSILFLVTGFFQAYMVEHHPVIGSGVSLLWRYFFPTITIGEPAYFDSKLWYVSHLFAITWLIYSLTASAICFVIHRRNKIK